MIERLHPLTLFFYFISTVGFSMCTRNPFFLAFSLVAAMLMLLQWQIRENKFSPKEIPVAIAFWLLVSLLNPLFNHNGETVLFYINQNRITQEALFFGMVAGEMLLAVLTWCRSLAYYMTTDKILLLFSGISKRGALVLSMILRFLPEYRREFRRRKEAQTLLGLFGQGTMVEKIKGNVMLFSSTADYAMEHSMETADSMSARGYDTARRTNYRTVFFRPVDGIFLVVFSLLSAGLIFLLTQKTMAMTFYPTLAFPKADPLFYLTLVIYGGICFSLPLYGAIKKR